MIAQIIDKHSSSLIEENMENLGNIDLIVPVYKNVDMLRECLSSLLENVAEIEDYKPRLVIVNDSPDDVDVAAYLAELVRGKAYNCEIILHTNDVNMGFVKSVNRGLKSTVENKRSAILVNADTITFSGTLLNLTKAAYLEYQIGFACPRSNNASLATFPHFSSTSIEINASPNRAYEIWKGLSCYLPDITYTPTVVGFYLFIKNSVLFEFDSLDETFGRGYEEENDLIMRANKVGFQSVLANKAFAFHYGSASFQLISESVENDKNKNLSLMVEKNPEFLPMVREYENSSSYVAEKLIGNLPISNRKVEVIFDLRRLWLSHNGTSKGTIMLLKAICHAGKDQFNFSALCQEDVYKFHNLHEIKNLNLVTTIDSKYSIAVNLGQPFDLDQINVLEKLAPLNVYGMLDIIAHDCGYLRLENNFILQDYWKHLANYADGLFYNSEFSKSVFNSRFKSGDNESSGQINTALLMPTTPDAYCDLDGVDVSQRQHILVLGNHFKHKHSVKTVKSLASRFIAAKFICFCGESFIENNIEYVRSGEISDQKMKWYFSNSIMVILPSFYEGFGIGLVEAIGFGKPAIVRRIPAAVEILSSYDSYSGVFLYDNDAELCKCVMNAINHDVGIKGGITQAQWGEMFCKFLHNVLNREGIYPNLVRRLYSSRFLNEDAQLRHLLSNTNEACSSEVKSDNQVFSKNTDDFKTDYGIKELFAVNDEREFIEGLYRVILGRLVDEVGLNHYLRVLTKYKGDRSRILVDILSSSELGLHNIKKHKDTSIAKWLLSLFK